MKYNRIMVAGCSGSGKSTFARELADLSGIPLIHLDQEHWQAGWVEPSKEEWRAQVRELVTRDRWVMDGNYSATWDLRLPRADLVIYLRYPLWLVIYRATKRVLRHRGEVRPDMAPGCPEHFNWEFYHFLFRCYFTRKKHHVDRLAKVDPQTEVLIFRKPSKLRQWLLDSY